MPIPRNSVRIKFLSYQICVLPSTVFEFTPLMYCSTIRLALHPAPYTTRPHSFPKKGASIIVVLPFLERDACIIYFISCDCIMNSSLSYTIYYKLLSKCLYQVRVIAVFTVFRLLTDFVCLYTYEF
jgi:hypothetical protein